MYDPVIERLSQISETLHVALKNKELDPELKAFYISQIKECEYTLNHYAGQDYVKKRELLYKSLSLFADMTLSFITVFLKRLGPQYKFLQDTTTKITRNRLGYHAARVDVLIDK